jgi:hypothetical protein
MNTNLTKLAGKACLSVVKAASLLIVSALVSNLLRSETTKSTTRLAQCVRYAQNKFIGRKIKAA